MGGLEVTQLMVNQNKMLVSIIIGLIILAIILVVDLGEKSYQYGNPIQNPISYVSRTFNQYQSTDSVIDLLSNT